MLLRVSVDNKEYEFEIEETRHRPTRYASVVHVWADLRRLVTDKWSLEVDGEFVEYAAWQIPTVLARYL